MAPEEQQSKEPRPDQGSSPYPPPGPTTESPSERADLPAVPPKQVPVIPEGGVSGEERRKGLPPEVVGTPDERLYAERFASERQEIDRPSPAWEPAPRHAPDDMAPNWPPKLEPQPPARSGGT
ncbi:MAG TPA: hypothetical protein VFI42_11820 [Thermomicrobiaceae bacterium]|nr:hypothetical protein [Thermomicrobiaceae bacterium]